MNYYKDAVTGCILELMINYNYDTRYFMMRNLTLGGVEIFRGDVSDIDNSHRWTKLTKSEAFLELL